MALIIPITGINGLNSLLVPLDYQNMTDGFILGGLIYALLGGIADLIRIILKVSHE